VKVAQQSIGCTMVLIAANVILMGLFAASFVQGPFSSDAQEFWYRDVSLAFLFGGAILPGTAALLWGRRSPLLLIALTVWMFVALIAWCLYALSSGGGV
jgi:hypothetical protein